jgi:molybdopterin converting factor small subunit
MAKIKISYYGIAQDYAGKNSETIDFSGHLLDLIHHIYTLYPKLQSPDIKIAVNEKIIKYQDINHHNIDFSKLEYSEIIFLPPFAGG